MESRDVEVAEKLAQELADQRHCSSAETNIHVNDCHEIITLLYQLFSSLFTAHDREAMDGYILSNVLQFQACVLVTVDLSSHAALDCFLNH